MINYLNSIREHVKKGHLNYAGEDYGQNRQRREETSDSIQYYAKIMVSFRNYGGLSVAQRSEKRQVVISDYETHSGIIVPNNATSMQNCK